MYKVYELQKSISKNAQKLQELNTSRDWQKIMELCDTIKAQALKAWDDSMSYEEPL